MEEQNKPSSAPQDWEGDRPEEEEDWTPASPGKRILAWTGVVYMVLFVLLNLYPFFNRGEYLYGVFPLMVCPAAVSLFILALHQLRTKSKGTNRVLMILLAIGCCVMFVLGLKDGLPPLLQALGGAP